MFLLFLMLLLDGLVCEGRRARCAGARGTAIAVSAAATLPAPNTAVKKRMRDQDGWLMVSPYQYFRGESGYGFVAEDIPELSIGVVAGRRGEGIGRALLNASEFVYVD